VLTGNSQPRYYDLLALRSKALSMDYDCLFDGDPEQKARRGNCFAYDIRVAPGAPIVAVDSAFNGIGVYSVAALRRSGCRYEAQANQTMCEHLSFHECLRRRGVRIGIDPALMVGCGAEHAHNEIPRSKFVRVHGNGSISYAGAPF